MATSRTVLSWRLSNTLYGSFCASALEEALARASASRISSTPTRAGGCRRAHLDGPPRALDGQRVYRAAVALAQAHMPTASATAANLRYGRMIETETETAKIPIKKTAHVVLTMGSTSSATVGFVRDAFPIIAGIPCLTLESGVLASKQAWSVLTG
jgi:hypothetical protein